VHDAEELRREARRLAERVGSRLRSKGLAGRTVTLKLRYPDFRTITRSATLPEPVDASAEIARLALALLERVAPGGVRLLGVSVRNLTPAPAHQEMLPLGDAAVSEAPAPTDMPEGAGVSPDMPGGSRVSPDIRRVQDAVDAVRARFGDDALGPAALLDPGKKSLRTGRKGTRWGPAPED
jgi:DNA polymerase-4